VVVVEGILALYDNDLRKRLDLRLYVETDADVRVLRRIERYLTTVKPMHEQFVRPTERDADLVVPEGANETAVALLRGGVEAAV